MPKVRGRRQRFPEGWELIKTTLDELQSQMRAAESSDTHGKRRDELLWPIFKIHHQRSRYLYEMYYVKEEISQQCFDFALSEGYGDRALISKWRKAGYERLCCLRCVQPKDTQFGTTCICRVPKSELEEGKLVECTHCGCRGCASGDV